ncbi:MAG: class I SAM-dependent methyltransferase [Methanofastidiosum sp.]
MALYKGETLISNEFIKKPIQENTKIFYNHFGRYFYAAKTLNIKKNHVCIDSSCGNGYGTFSLADKCKYIFGLDINQEYIDLAKKDYNNPNIIFCTYNDFYSNYTNILADRIICIETIEHIPKEEINDFINKLLSKLKLGGSMFVTIPLGNNEPSSYNEFHLNEMSIGVVYGLFSPHFTNMNIEIDNFTNSFGYDCQYCYLILKNKK